MKYNIGDIIIVSIISVAPYGVFVKVDDNYTGLIHISEISTRYIKDINTYFNDRKELTAKIIPINEEKKQISLSLKDIENSRKNKLREDGSGFLKLKNELPKWINEAKIEINGNK